ncbi:hypothetical protein PC128_g22386 [Phytophthora cactorum]|nr:hypothetical protein PC128_g22386 [Phytophthora cactorum]
MYSCILFPPNVLSLSDNVIGDVLTRTRTTKINFREELSTERSPRSQLSRATTDTISVKSQQRSRSFKPAEKTSPVPATDVNNPVGHPQCAALLRQLQKNEQDRERCRQSQDRFRNKQMKLKADLENDNNHLRVEIGILEWRRHISTCGVPIAPTVCSVATEYFRLFRHGFKSPSQPLYSFAIKFIEKSMASEVADGLLLGPNALLANWKMISLYFDDVDFKLERLEERSTDSVLVATTVTSFTVTSDTLRIVFPHLNSDGEGGNGGGEWSALANKLAGQRLVLHGSVKFYWDNSTDRVVRMETRSDLLTPMLHILGSLKDVSLAFSGAFVKPDCTLVPRSII